MYITEMIYKANNILSNFSKSSLPVPSINNMPTNQIRTIYNLKFTIYR